MIFGGWLGRRGSRRAQEQAKGEPVVMTATSSDLSECPESPTMVR